MGMHNPPHPGEFIREIYVTPYELSVRKVADSLGVSPSTLNRLLNGQSNISPESWLAMQDQYDLWHARKNVNLKRVKKLDVSAA